ncbi:RNA-directed DNA polymerase, eukaryota [Tanacetum coccineum]|uniref:RNA-directed DNA polymerase, eukaryota n=1 Tax=Tanacetum coccineum TaxID=301880 RepID=A0ABQ5G6J8_9ASTR
MAFKSRSNADHTRLISKSIFITNFPDVTTSKDLWVLCQSYGTVVDVFIPNRMSKAGKRFAFVRFIKVDNVERLVGNLCTLWIGRKHLQANVARFDRDSIPSKRVPYKFNHVAPTPTSFVSAVKGVSSPPIPLASSPALVLDDSCMVARDLDNFVMGEVLPRPKLKFMKHTGVASWFVRLCNAQNDFVASDRIVWVDIEGVPLHAWSHATFHKIGSQWGEVMELEDGNEDLFARKRLCIKTKHANNILDSFKIIVKGKNFQIRAKELFVWSPSFKEVPEVVHCSDDESVKNEADINVVDNTVNNEGEESDSEAVSDTFFGDNGDAQEHDNEVDQTLNDKEVSKDPFNIYDLLNRHKKEVGNSGMESSIPYPPGFTPENSRVFEEVEKSDINIQSDGRVIRDIRKEGGSILDILDEMIKVGLGSKAKKDWIRELTTKHKVSFLSLQETKKESFSDLEVKYFWGNYQFDHIVSEALGYSGGILCVWDSNVFHKKHHIISDNFVALYGTWIPRKIQLLIISVYAPQSYASKCQLWDFIASLINQWNGECMVMGDFNEVRCKEDRWGSTFLAQGACSFNSFISNAGLNEVQLEGYSFTWAHPSASKMSKLDRFFVTDGFLSLFPHISAVCLDRHLSDHRPILLREMLVDFGATPFRLYHSWLSIPGFDQMITSTWNSFILVDSNGMIRFKKKLQLLKKEIRKWVAEYKNIQSNSIRDVKNKLSDIDKLLDQGGVTDDVLLSRMEAMKQLQELNSSVNCDFVQKAKVRWAIEGDENSKFFHGIINRKRANLSVKGIMIEGEWVDDPIRVKDEFRNHFADRFNDPGTRHGRINFSFPNRLTFEQVSDLEASVSDEEIRKAVWGCGENKSPGPDGFTFEFFRKFWTVVGPDFCIAVKWFFEHGFFATGCNSSFVTLIPKTLDPKLVSEFRPISLIGSLYKVVTKILATRLSFVISDLISNVQTAFLPNRQILDGPFIINEILARCKHKNQQAMFFKVDFAKAYDSIRWDYLDDVLNAFGFGSRWRSWIQGSLNSGKASVLVNGSPTSEFQFHRGLKQGDPLAPFLFILIMESLHLSFNRAVEAGIFTGLRIDDALTISHLFYADDAIFIGEWSKENLKGILNILNCFSLLSGMSINLKKSHILGLGIRGSIVSEAAASLGCSVMKTPFNYLGIMVGGNMSLVKSWDETVHKLTKRLSKWKLKTLSIGGRLTLLKSVLGSTPIYNMSIFKVPKTVLNKMENLRRNFFNGIQEGDRKITWVKWHTVLAAKKFGGLGVSSFFALNRGLLAKWVWRFLSQDNSLWCQLISAIHGSNITDLSTAYPSTWNSIIKEFNYLKVQGVDVFSHCKIRIGNGLHTRFWKDLWIGDCTLSGLFPRLFALDTEKDISVAGKLQSPLVSSFRRNVRGGIEEQQLEHLVALLDSVILSNSNDRWVSDLNGDGVFRVKDVRNLLDEFFLPRADIPTRWVKNIPIKVNIFAWKLALDRLPTRANLVQRNVVTESQSCPLCDAILEDTSHLFFNCSLARDVTRLLCRWWNLGVQSFSSYAEWLVWFNSVRLASNLKVILEGVFMLRGGVCGISGTNYFSRVKSLVKSPFSMILFYDLFVGVKLEVVIS